MNKFKEFDYIHTPDDWLDLHKTKNNQFIFKRNMIYISIIICIIMSSIGLIYANYNQFMRWLNQTFNKNEIVEISPHSISQKNNWHIDHHFLCYTHEDNDKEILDKVFVFENGHFIEKNIEHMEVKGSLSFSFDYVIKDNQICAYSYDDCIFEIYHLYDNGLIYFWGEVNNKNNIYSLNMKTKEINQITYDNISVNSIMSPEGRFLLINKDDQYWTCYDTQLKTEKRTDDIDPYAHDNVIGFLDESHIVTYNMTYHGEYNESITTVIDLETLKAKNYKGLGYYPRASTLDIEIKENKVCVTDLVSNITHQLSLNVQEYDYYTFGNQYILFNDNESQKIIIYDFTHNQMKKLNYSYDIKNINCTFIDNEYLIISDENNYCIISLTEVFS